VAVSLSYHNNEPVAESLRKMNRHDYGLCMGKKKLFNQLPQYLSSWSDHVKSWTSESGLPVRVIRYEDMHAAPRETFGAALKFLDIPYNQEQLDRAIHFSSIDVLQDQERKDGFQEKPPGAQSFFRKGTVSDWRQHLDERTAYSFLHLNSPVFDQYY
jgi:hypothetical protein